MSILTNTINANTTTPLQLKQGGSQANLTASNGGLVYSTASAMAILAGTATANQVPLSGSNAAPSWSTATYPATTTINRLLYSSAANTITGLATANSGILSTNGSGVPAINTPATVAALFTAPTIQQFSSGSGTYTLPANCKYITVEIVGGGGGGGGGGSAAPGTGTNGADTTFGTAFLTAGGGAANGGAGGAVTGGDVTAIGGVGFNPVVGTVQTSGGPGGYGPLSVGGSANFNAAGGMGKGYGGGGGGGGASIQAIVNSSGGSAGAYIRKLITSPSATYAYSVGAAGSGGAAGTSGQAGGNGSAGIVTVYEYYI